MLGFIKQLLIGIVISRTVLHLILSTTLVVLVAYFFLDPIRATFSGLENHNHQLVQDKAEINRLLIRYLPPADIRRSAINFVLDHEKKRGHPLPLTVAVAWDINNNILISWYPKDFRVQCVALIDKSIQEFLMGPHCQDLRP